MVVTEPEQFDLSELEGVEEVLGSAKLEPGQYQQIRFDTKEVLLDIFSNLWCAEEPSEKLVLDGEFELVAGETTVLTLDCRSRQFDFLPPWRQPWVRPGH